MNRLLTIAIAIFSLQAQAKQAQQPNSLEDALSNLKLDPKSQELCGILFMQEYQQQICAKQKSVEEEMVSRYGRQAVNPAGTNFCDAEKINADAARAKAKMSHEALATCEVGLNLFAEAHRDGNIQDVMSIREVRGMHHRGL
jgi:hypothetical protein